MTIAEEVRRRMKKSDEVREALQKSLTEEAERILACAPVKVRNNGNGLSAVMKMAGLQGHQGHSPGVWANVSGMKGPMGYSGDTGDPGETGPKPYALSYCDIIFKQYMARESFEVFEDPTCITGDELAFLKVINPTDWEAIRSAWAKEWQMKQAYDAFELGAFGDE